jgi:hypothetical protein
MYGVIVEVRIDTHREREMRKMVKGEVVPRAKQLAGFVSGYWMQAPEGESGAAVMLFESEESARAAIAGFKATGPLAEKPVWSMVAANFYEVFDQS